MRIKGAVLLVIGIVILLASYFFLGAHDVNAILGALCLGIGGASVVSSLVFLFMEKPKMQ
ncbi:MAG: hypothetical protein Q4A82_00645 [Corynebacterium sp.]|nr:hypothetical protein [Corynebacterium sp.]